LNGLSAFFSGKCPQCRSGNVFKHPVTKLTKFKDMHENCPSCGVKFESEPGFFWGAMYFSYALNVAMFIIIGFFFFTYSDDVNIGWFIGTIVGVSFAVSPISFRLSRLFMMYITAPYRKYKGS
jgi:uncharacterized protein (DUF983 family)